MRNFTPLCLLTCLLILVACKDDEGISTSEKEQQLIQAHIDSLAVDVVQDEESGLYFYPITINPDGKTQNEGNVLSIFYRMEVLGGNTIDVYDSLDQDTLMLKQGVNAIYPVGLDLALGYLKEGEKWGFILPSNIAYGDFSYSTLIPENAIIEIEIELIKIQNEEEVLEDELLEIAAYVNNNGLRDTVSNPLNQPELLANGMVYKRLSAGNGARLTIGELGTVTYEGRLMDSTVFDRAPAAAPFEFIYGEGTVIPGFEVGVSRMQGGERALIIMPSYLAYRESAQVVPLFLTSQMVDLEIVPQYVEKVGPYEPLIFEIELINVN